MKPSIIITVEKWFFDRIIEEARAHGLILHGAYTVENGIEKLDSAKLRINEVLGETEKEWHVLIDAENASGYNRFRYWIPKSAIVDNTVENLLSGTSAIAYGKNACNDGAMTVVYRIEPDASSIRAYDSEGNIIVRSKIVDELGSGFLVSLDLEEDSFMDGGNNFDPDTMIEYRDACVDGVNVRFERDVIAFERYGTLISLAEYAKLNGKSHVTIRQRAQRGSFRTAIKIGRNWVIDSDEPLGDNRVTSGIYRGWRK